MMDPIFAFVIAVAAIGAWAFFFGQRPVPAAAPYVPRQIRERQKPQPTPEQKDARKTEVMRLANEDAPKFYKRLKDAEEEAERRHEFSVNRHGDILVMHWTGDQHKALNLAFVSDVNYRPGRMVTRDGDGVMWNDHSWAYATDGNHAMYLVGVGYSSSYYTDSSPRSGFPTRGRSALISFTMPKAETFAISVPCSKGDEVYRQIMDAMGGEKEALE